MKTHLVHLRVCKKVLLGMVAAVLLLLGVYQFVVINGTALPTWVQPPGIPAPGVPPPVSPTKEEKEEEEADWHTHFYNATADRMQPLWTWPRYDNGSLVPARNVSVVLFNAPKWFRIGSLEEEHRRRQCPVPCSFSTDSKRRGQADALVFYMVDYPRGPPPPPRTPGQIWLVLSLEPPFKTRGSTFALEKWHNQINWTINYREDADIWFPYGRFHPRHDGKGDKEGNMTSTGRRLVAWVVSHCRTPSKRDKYVSQLQQHIPVDVFGACSKLKCNKDCVQMVGQTYRFYLALENSLWRDYHTEKVYRYVAQAGLISVVRGGARYARFLPRGSYVDTADFPSPRALAQHLKRVAASPSLQASYLAWRRRLELEQIPGPACQLCVRLLRPQAFPRVYPDVWDWFTRGVCRSPTDV